MKKSSKAIIKTIKLSEIVPYWRNPRDNDEAVDKVVESIKRYGYQQLIIVDKENVIIAGHTRYKALQILNYDEIEVKVADLSEGEAKQYRIIDNKTAEYAKWNDNLVLELKEFADLSLLTDYFPEINLSADYKDLDIVKASENMEQNMEERSKELAEQYTNADTSRIDQLIDITCPHCYKTFSQTREAILTNRSMETKE